MSCADRRYPASLDRVSAIRTANVAPSAGISGDAIAATWSCSATGTIARIATRLSAATARDSTSQPTTDTPAGSDPSHVIGRTVRGGSAGFGDLRGGSHRPAGGEQHGG